MRKVFVSGGFGPHVAVIIGLLVLQGVFNYYFSVMANNLDIENLGSILLVIFILHLFSCLTSLMIEYYTSSWVTAPYEIACERYLLDIKERANPRFLNSIKNLQKVIPDGVQAMQNLSGSCFNIMNPFILTITQIFALSNIISLNQMTCIILFLIIFFIGGMYGILYEYNSKKINQERINNSSEGSRSILDVFVTYIFNGTERFASSEIQKNTMEKVKLATKTHIFSASIYIFLDIIRIGVFLFIVWFIFQIKNSLTHADMFKIFWTLFNVFFQLWWLFHSMRMLITSTASWGTVENFLSNYVRLDETKLNPLEYPSQILKQLEHYNEVRLYAESGGGKTTWMKEKVAWVTENFIAGSWAYLEQKMRLPKTNLTIRQFMVHKTAPSFLKDSLKVDKDLCHYADMIGIGNLINHNTLDKTFDCPSGGEEKRILSLQAFLPILLGDDKVKVIFCDEITAGLDPKNFEKFRDLVQILKDKGIRFITIEHHDIEAHNLEVMKRIVTVSKSKKNASKGIHNILEAIVKFVSPKNDDNPKKEPEEETIVEAWVNDDDIV
jgi:ABC-type multidrug transport system ATPase subunit